MNEFDAAHYVADFVGPELITEVTRRIADGQTVGQALNNAGDRADRVWSWAPNWDNLYEVNTWTAAAEWFKAWGSEHTPEDDFLEAAYTH